MNTFAHRIALLASLLACIASFVGAANAGSASGRTMYRVAKVGAQDLVRRDTTLASDSRSAQADMEIEERLDERADDAAAPSTIFVAMATVAISLLRRPIRWIPDPSHQITVLFDVFGRYFSLPPPVHAGLLIA